MVGVDLLLGGGKIIAIFLTSYSIKVPDGLKGSYLFNLVNSVLGHI